MVAARGRADGVIAPVLSILRVLRGIGTDPSRLPQKYGLELDNQQ